MHANTVPGTGMGCRIAVLLLPGCPPASTAGANRESRPPNALIPALCVGARRKGRHVRGAVERNGTPYAVCVVGTDTAAGRLVGGMRVCALHPSTGGHNL